MRNRNARMICIQSASLEYQLLVFGFFVVWDQISNSFDMINFFFFDNFQ